MFLFFTSDKICTARITDSTFSILCEWPTSHQLFVACCKNTAWELTVWGYTNSYRSTKNIERRPCLGRPMKMMADAKWGTIISGPYFSCMLYVYTLATPWLIRQSSGVAAAIGAVRGAEQHHWDEHKWVAYQQHHFFYSQASVLPSVFISFTTQSFLIVLLSDNSF